MKGSLSERVKKSVWKAGTLYRCAVCGVGSGCNYCSTPSCVKRGTACAYMVPNPIWEESVGRDWRESMRRFFG